MFYILEWNFQNYHAGYLNRIFQDYFLSKRFNFLSTLSICIHKILQTTFSFEYVDFVQKIFLGPCSLHQPGNSTTELKLQYMYPEWCWRWNVADICILQNSPTVLWNVCFVVDRRPALQSLTGSLQDRITTQGDPCSHYREWVCRVQLFSVLVTLLPCFINI